MVSAFFTKKAVFTLEKNQIMHVSAGLSLDSNHMDAGFCFFSNKTPTTNEK